MLGFTVAALLGVAAAIPTISTKGSKFFTSNGNQWYIKGVAYQLTDADPLADGTQCALDASLMQTLGANAIRVYHVDPTANHDSCMQSFSNAGIYAFIDLDTFTTYINPISPNWTTYAYQAYAQVMDAFHGYDNVAGFFVGNEVLNSGSNSPAAPYVKAAAADMKAYRSSKGYRNIPIGYSASDIPDLRPNLQNYLACGGNASQALDFFSLNAYEWCGQNTFMGSGYSQLEMNATDYSIPIWFSETGCNTIKPRTFGDQAAILGPDMDDTWSGAMIYEWIEETNDYGLISYGAPAPTSGPVGSGVVAGYTRTGTPTPISPDFPNLSSQWATLNPTGVSMSAYTPTNSAPECPSYTSNLWMVSGNVPLPTIGAAVNVPSVSQSSASSRSGSPSGSSSGAPRSSGSGSASGSASASRSGSATASSPASSAAAGAASSASGAAASATSAASAASAEKGAVVAGGFMVMMMAIVGAL
ncbi:glycoside hydrolase family 72 protein [Baudoinia panamericana UAMH 10762]|uniref:1,3-beta-glucanosyltransferase n=1 Tax=Baudoinia panamericana (strain UAMH 10762) TaxID=717646 RepID=M2M0M8_BAUPA|nr:glycoside hydrolase family 72 protein [Baudoinia panamericana UAMH 10762]EMD00553.1 glycoside hydrolase family 72 protein [Baudoinia panamericana UAMH 10762]